MVVRTYNEQTSWLPGDKDLYVLAQLYHKGLIKDYIIDGRNYQEQIEEAEDHGYVVTTAFRGVEPAIIVTMPTDHGILSYLEVSLERA